MNRKEMEITDKDIVFIKDSFNNRKVSISKIAGYFDCSEDTIKELLISNDFIKDKE